jgi:ABC-type glycerol-3-phosphate transport system permease component
MAAIQTQGILAWGRRKSVQKAIGDVFTYAALIVLSLAAVAPLIFVLSTSFKEMGDVFQFPPKFIPNPFTLSAYQEALTLVPMPRYFVNSSYIAIMVVIGSVATACLVAYGFSRYRAPGKDLLFLLILSPMFLPQQVTLIPLFLAYKSIGWMDTYLPLIVPHFFGGGAFFIFLLRQFFASIPRDLDEAARIDGCGELAILWRIVLPLSKPAMAVVAIFSFMGSWNDFMSPLIYLNSVEKLTVTLGLSKFQGMYGATLWNSVMAGTVLIVLPPLILFLAAQRYFVEGIHMTGLTG